MADENASPHGEPLRVLAFEFQADARTSQIGKQSPLDRIPRAIEKHFLNPDVIVKIFEVPNARHGAAGMQMQRGGCVG